MIFFWWGKCVIEKVEEKDVYSLGKYNVCLL